MMDARAFCEKTSIAGDDDSGPPYPPRSTGEHTDYPDCSSLFTTSSSISFSKLEHGPMQPVSHLTSHMTLS